MWNDSTQLDVLLRELSQIQTGKGEVLITNDGHTILKDMAVMHPAAKMVKQLSLPIYLTN